MIKLLVIADDFTGAMDTGVQFAKKSIASLVKITTVGDKLEDAFRTADCEVLVLDIESRHIAPKQATLLVAKVVKQALACGVEYIYKKTDSTLRGNIGSELTALLKTMQAKELVFIPAFPQAGRITRNGLHYVNSNPLAQSEYAKDPFNPVLSSNVHDIIREQSSIPIREIHQGEYSVLLEKTCGLEMISIVDATTTEDLKKVGEVLAKAGKLRCLAGCAGFAETLTDFLNLKRTPLPYGSNRGEKLLISGSLNTLARRQVQYAEAVCGYTRMEFPDISRYAGDNDDLMNDFVRFALNQLKGTGKLVIETPQVKKNAQQVQSRFIALMGKVTSLIMNHADIGTLIVFGGDTLMGIMNELQCDTLQPIQEVDSGVVYAKPYKKGCGFEIITKAGGLGKEDVAKRIDAFLDGIEIAHEA